MMKFAASWFETPHAYTHSKTLRGETATLCLRTWRVKRSYAVSTFEMQQWLPLRNNIFVVVATDQRSQEMSVPWSKVLMVKLAFHCSFNTYDAPTLEKELFSNWSHDLASASLLQRLVQNPRKLDVFHSTFRRGGWIAVWINESWLPIAESLTRKRGKGNLLESVDDEPGEENNEKMVGVPEYFKVRTTETTNKQESPERKKVTHHYWNQS